MYGYWIGIDLSLILSHTDEAGLKSWKNRLKNNTQAWAL